MRLPRLVGGSLAVAASALLLVIVLVRDVGLNPANGWTITLGFIGGAMAIARAGSVSVLAAWFLVLLASLPALIGGVGLLFVPSLVLLPFGRHRTYGTERPADRAATTRRTS